MSYDRPCNEPCRCEGALCTSCLWPYMTCHTPLGIRFRRWRTMSFSGVYSNVPMLKHSGVLVQWPQRAARLHLACVVATNYRTRLQRQSVGSFLRVLSARAVRKTANLAIFSRFAVAATMGRHAKTTRCGPVASECGCGKRPFKVDPCLCKLGHCSIGVGSILARQARHSPHGLQQRTDAAQFSVPERSSSDA